MGKTITTLTALTQLLEAGKSEKVLIIAPLRVARDTWPEEIVKWDHTKRLQFEVLVGPPKKREAALERQAEIYIINRENLPWLVKHVGRHWPFDTVIIDELSSFKNHQSKRFKALRKVRPQIKRIAGLTGTPAPNSLLDLWAPYRLLDQGKRLGTRVTTYRETYFTPDKRSAVQVFTWKPKPGADKAIYDTIADITLSLRTQDHLDLPPRTTTTRTVNLKQKERKAYQDLAKRFVTEVEGQEIEASDAGVLAGKLMQLASGNLYHDGQTIQVHTAKLEALDDIVESADGQTILVAYWFKAELEALLERYPEGRELSTSEDMADWNAGRIPIAFIHPASAGHGLNLQAGGHLLVWLTTPWSLELYEQTNARLDRQGQTQPVSVIHIAAAGTIDQDIQAALERKDTTQSALISAVKAQLKGDG